ncbi:formimidoylglutamate deiminase [Solicola gregarius]|uniref:Formimidoylglutamate deiminase n=1 Tax=Solicola gregarius TaxID=2908642 RepID=A0AA46TKN9_9ACTN|nr:formimidoylglutamate deiminase [Solicola gregarius]UYM07072.1 formimidoylglutamate deiminase [Solicola gregarius]
MSYEIGGFANCHSHVFHRALRGRTHGGGGTFWTWREQMYALAGALDPDLLYDLARATYAEMALAGITSVGEFHYLHHAADGGTYDDPNAMGEAVVEAAKAAGIRVALLDTCYLSGGFGREVDGVQRRYTDGDVDAWAERVDALHATYADDPDVVVGAAVHSVRAVPAEQISGVVAWATTHGAPLHVHLSEQPAENDECRAVHGMTPTALLSERGVWETDATAVHATHLSAADISALGASRTYACFCPTTERDLADGVGPADALRDAGATLTLGSDSNAVVDMFEEMRAVELDERLVSGRRGTWQAGALLAAATSDGHRSLGFAATDDRVRVAYDSVRLAGSDPGPGSLVFAAAPADVREVVVGNEPIVQEGRHVRIDDVARDLDRAIRACWERV